MFLLVRKCWDELLMPCMSSKISRVNWGLVEILLMGKVLLKPKNVVVLNLKHLEFFLVVLSIKYFPNGF